ncbi:MAG TPA: hypothetical protein V6C71_21420 [Coleofasciculaceae cyanobacterium]|jgi:hypothetical protein
MSKQLLSLSIVASILIPNIVLAEQVVVQQGSTNATAIGNHNFAASSVEQSATQNQSANPNAYINEQGQTVVQQGQSSAAAVGQDNVVISEIEQNSVQNQSGNYGDPNNQQAIQNATDNAAAIGQQNTIINTTGQYNLQNQWSY